MNKFNLLFFFCLISFITHGQNKITYIYDDSGNRTDRVIVLSRSIDNSSKDISTIEDNASKYNFRIYPNPTKGQLAIEILDYQENISGDILVYDLKSNLILKDKISTSTTNLDISIKPSGVYIMKIIINKEVSTWKIIKE